MTSSRPSPASTSSPTTWASKCWPRCRSSTTSTSTAWAASAAPSNCRRWSPCSTTSTARAKVSPFVGAGLNYTTFFSEDTTGALAGSKLKLQDSWGLAAHGVDFAIGEGRPARGHALDRHRQQGEVERREDRHGQHRSAGLRRFVRLQVLKRCIGRGASPPPRRRKTLAACCPGNCRGFCAWD